MEDDNMNKAEQLLTKTNKSCENNHDECKGNWDH